MRKSNPRGGHSHRGLAVVALSTMLGFAVAVGCPTPAHADISSIAVTDNVVNFDNARIIPFRPVDSNIGSTTGNADIPTISIQRVDGTWVDVNRMYRLYNPNSGEHFYTASRRERDKVTGAGWRYEGTGWFTPAKHSNAPVYRLYSGTDHHYTTSKRERDNLVCAGWKYEGIGWYSDDKRGEPLYRQFNPNVDPGAARNNSGSHNYTRSKAENDTLVRAGWRAEGIGWYGVK